MAPYLRRLPPGRQEHAADDLRWWAARYFGKDGSSVVDELLGVRVVVVDGVRGRTAGRWTAPGIREAVDAVRLRLADGNVPKKTACRDVARVISDHIATVPVANERHAKVAAEVVNRLERRLYDALRRNHSK